MPKNTALPLKFLARMATLLDEGFTPFLASLNRRPLSGLRVNTLKISAAAFRELSPWPLRPVPWCPDGFIMRRKANAGMHPWHEAGLYYLQEPSTMAVVPVLAPQPGERVLDLCGAPGGKATHLAAHLGPQGLLVANEVNRKRSEILRANLARFGVRNAVVLNEAPERLAQRWPASFDRVLVDAPCSGEGMFRKNEDARTHWSEAHVAGCALRQDAILESAASLVRPGGYLAYATCTFAPEENEGAIRRFLQAHPEFDTVKPAWHPGFEPGHADWGAWPQAPEAEPLEALGRTVRLWPHKVQAEGHFVALLRRSGAEAPANWPLAEPVRLSAAERRQLDQLWQSVMTLPLPERLLLRPSSGGNTEVIALSPGTPDCRGLRTVQPGWSLGMLRSGASSRGPQAWRFEPSYSLALAITGGDARQVLDEAVGSPLITRYLRGETLPVPGPDGWILVAVGGYPLGWGKRSHGVVKNHYPKALRWG